MKSFFCSVVSFTILANKDLPHFVLASSSWIYFLYVVAEVEKVGSSFTRFGQDGWIGSPRSLHSLSCSKLVAKIMCRGSISVVDVVWIDADAKMKPMIA
jgi:hypothetical protein